MYNINNTNRHHERYIIGIHNKQDDYITESKSLFNKFKIYIIILIQHHNNVAKSRKFVYINVIIDLLTYRNIFKY